jgi:hypothetical protein
MCFCAFVALMASGFSWLLNDVIKLGWGFLDTVEWIADLGVSICAFLAGWVWLCTSTKPGTFRIVLQVFFVIFAVLAIFGIVSTHYGWF